MPTAASENATGIADQQHDDQRREHQRRDVGDQEGAHGWLTRAFGDALDFLGDALLAARAQDLLGELLFGGLGRRSSRRDRESVPCRNAIRLISSETPCRISRKKPIGTSSRAGQMIRPPALVDTSLRVLGVDEQRPRQPHDQNRHREKKEDRAEDVDPAARAWRQPAGDDVDAHVLVVQQRVAGAEEEDRREQVPLDLEEGVRAVVEGLRTTALAALISTATRISQ